jgi:Domain of unknown function (DUF4872)/Butirosin biosynthesis protein H, N-terminal
VGKTASQIMVPGYRHLPGNHCGSTALRNLLAFHGLDVSEELAFGLGAGACFYYVVINGQSPSRFTNGRAPIQLDTTEDAGESWERARTVVDSGRPAILLTDLYHLDHYGRSAHFPGHAVVLAGYEPERAYLSDTGFEELQTTSLDSLALARHEQHPAYPISGHMFHIPDGASLGDLAGAAPRAIERAVRGMLEPELGEFQGLPALRRFTAEVGEWPNAADDWRWCARFGYQVIERRGTGGGNFRAMYARFLAEVGYYDEAALAGEAGERWSALAAAFLAASDADAPNTDLWSAVGEEASRVLDAEERLWTGLVA